jgi:hypothetical protein
MREKWSVTIITGQPEWHMTGKDVLEEYTEKRRKRSSRHSPELSSTGKSG